MLADQRPEACLPSARRLNRDSPHSLALAYARCREPHALFNYQPTAEERDVLGAGRAALAQATGLSGLRRPCQAWTYTNDCVALRNQHEFPAMLPRAASALICAPALRQHIILEPDYRTAWSGAEYSEGR